jgi:hypothetical protein
LGVCYDGNMEHEQVFYPRANKILGLVYICFSVGIACALALYLKIEMSPVTQFIMPIGSVFSVGFGLALIIAFLQKMPRLQIDQEGFTNVGLWQKKRYLWRQIKKIEMTQLGNTKCFTWTMLETTAQKTWLDLMWSNMIGDVYTTSLFEIKSIFQKHLAAVSPTESLHSVWVGELP